MVAPSLLSALNPAFICTSSNPLYHGPKGSLLYLGAPATLRHAPYATWPMGLSSSMPGAIKFVLGSPLALAAEHRAIVGELARISS